MRTIAKTDSHARAMERLRQEASLWMEREGFAAHLYVVRRDIVVLTCLPFSGGELALLGIERNQKGFLVVEY